MYFSFKVSFLVFSVLNSVDTHSTTKLIVLNATINDTGSSLRHCMKNQDYLITSNKRIYRSFWTSS